MWDKYSEFTGHKITRKLVKNAIKGVLARTWVEIEELFNDEGRCPYRNCMGIEKNGGKKEGIQRRKTRRKRKS